MLNVGKAQLQVSRLKEIGFSVGDSRLGQRNNAESSRLNLCKALPDMPLANQYTGMVHGLGKAQLEDQSLQAAL